MELNVDTTAAEQPTLTIDTGIAPPQPPSEEVAQTRAYKTHMGLGDVLKMDQPTIYRSIADGQEQHLRESAAMEITAQAVQDKQRRLVELAATKGSALTLADVTALDAAPADPKAVIEQGYSRAYMNTLKDSNDRLGDTVLSDAMAENPSAVQDYFNRSSDVLTKREYAATAAQNLQPAIEKNAYFSFNDPRSGEPINVDKNTLRNLATAGFYDSVLLRGNTKETSRFGFLGNVLEDQANELKRLPFPEFQKEFDKIVTNLQSWDPKVAQEFARAVSGLSDSDKIVYNVSEGANAALTIAGLAGVRTTARNFGPGQLKNLGDLSRGEDGTYRPGGPSTPPPGGSGGGPAQITSDDLGRGAMGVQEVLRQSPVPPTSPNLIQAARAVDDVLKSSSVPEVSKSTIAEGAGDIQEASIQKVITSIQRPDPIKEGVDVLMSGWKSSDEAMRTFGGDLSRENYNRLLTASNTYQKGVVELLTNTSQVVRTPALMEEGFRSIEENIRHYFPGRENTIGDINFRVQQVGPLTVHADVDILNYGAVPFSSYELAANHARLNGYDLSGIEGRSGEKVFIPTAALVRQEHRDIFTTAKGSTYEVHEDKTTTRNKKARPEHPGDEGPKQRSDWTGYITPAQYQDIQNKKKMRGEFKDEPEIGLIPVERWRTGPLKGKVHFGNVITEGGSKAVNQPRNFEIQRLPDGSFKFLNEDGIEIVPSATPQPGMTPYNLTTNKFEKPLTEETARIEQKGLGFRIVVTIPLNETENFVRDKLIGGSRNKTLSSKDTSRLTQITNAVLGYIRNPYDTLSKTDNENRAKTVFGQSKFIDLVKQEIKDVEDIYKGLLTDRNVFVEKPLSYTRTLTGANRIVARDFTRALVASQTMNDRRTDLPGYYMQTPAEIQHFWQSNFQRPASFKEQSAYLAIGRLDYFDHILRAVGMYRNKARAGVMSWAFSTVKDGVSTPSVRFDARQVKIVDNGEDITLIVDVDGKERYWHKMGTEAQKNFRLELEQGRYRGVELWDPEKRPLKRVDEEGNQYRIRFVFSNVLESKPITFDQLGYRGGGHWQYDYDNAVKQAIVRPQRIKSKVQHIYEGDTTFGFVGNRVEGEYFATHMNEIARLVKARQYKDAKNYAKQYFDIEWKKLYGAFRPSKNPLTGEISPPRFSTDPRQAFRVVPSGKTILDLDKELEKQFTRTHPKTDKVLSTFVDGTRHGSLARNFQVDYTQERDSYDLNEFKNVGSVDKPFYEFRPAKLTDPIATLTRSMDRIVNSTYMDDQKISSIEHWLEENKDLLEADIKELRANPFFFFNEGKYKKNVYTTPRVAIAESNRYKIKQFIGMPSFTDSVIQGIKQTLLDGMYELGRDTSIAKLDKVVEKGGALSVPAKIVRAPLIMPEWMLQNTPNPIDFMRGMTYHSYLGLFAVKQVFVQSMAYTTIYGLAGPRLAASGSIAALLHQWSRINSKPGIIDALDQKATLFGWKLGEFKEAMHFGDRSGMFSVRNEISLDNGLHKQTFFRNDAKGILDAGQKPFHEGNLNVRFGAWYTAFREFRDANPFVKIGPIEEGKILRRANILNTMMTRDANTVLNKGVVGIPFQFFDYMKKVTDTFWGMNIGDTFKPDKLVQDKDGVYRPVSRNTFGRRSYVRARLLLMYALIGGPVGSIGVTGLPFGDYIRQKAIEGTLPFQTEPYIQGDHVFSTVMMEGPTSALIAWITGGGDMLKGTFYNFNNRFNPEGMQQISDLMKSDISFWKVVLGAVGTDMGNKLASLSGFVNALYSMAEGDPTKERWPLKLDDWTAPLKTVSSWNDGDRLIYALSFGKWLDRHGRPTSDVGKIDAIFRTLTGLTDQRIDDMYLKTLTNKERKAQYDKAFREYEENRYKAEQALQNKDPEQADDYNKRAFFALKRYDVPVELWPKAFARDGQMNRNTIDKNNDSYYLRNVPQTQQEKARDAYRKLQ